DNGTYGTIRMHQEREYPGRVSGSDLFNPDFAKLAEAFGFAAFYAERTEDV
ncbi:thiamine pyrophosphate-dependent enzyme, partial [Vibrio parahaemolyticus]